MSDEEFEIEYLEEDEDVVQTCLETLVEPQELITKPPKIFRAKRVLSPSSLLVERVSKRNDRQSRKKTKGRNKRKVKHDEDSDYEPLEDDDDDDYDPEEPPKKPKRQRKCTPKRNTFGVLVKVAPNIHQTLVRPFNKEVTIKQMYSPNTYIGKVQNKDPLSTEKIKTTPKRTPISNPLKCKPSHNEKPKKTSKAVSMLGKISPGMRPQFNRLSHSPTFQKFIGKIPIQTEKKAERLFDIPRHQENPFKLFVKDVYLYDYQDPKHIKAEILSKKYIKDRWNQVCRKQIEKCGATESAGVLRTTQFIRKIDVNVRGKVENVIRLHVDEKLDGTSDNFQAILPKFKTQEIDIKFNNSQMRREKSQPMDAMTILTKEARKESTNDAQVLVAFNTKEFRSTTFEMVENGVINEKKVKRHLKMLMSCKMCASCYQYSWRGHKDQKASGDVRCAVCSAPFTSAYNLLTHVRSHRLTQKQERSQNKILAEIMGYHYKCRLCRYRAGSIRDLRNHLRLHRSAQKFKCEVGQHITD